MTTTDTSPAPSGATSPAPSQGTNPEDTIQPQDLAEIQGIILRGYRLDFARHFVLQILNPAAFKQFLAKLVPGSAGAGPLTISTSEQWPNNQKPEYCLNMGFSWAGIQALNLPGATFGSSFDFTSFKAGAPARANYVGDVGNSAPASWVSCLNPANASNAHAVLTLFANSTEALESNTTALQGMFTAGGAAQALTFGPSANPGPPYFDAAALPDDTIHFGYADGISQPQVSGMTPPRPPDQQPALPAWGVVLRNSAQAPYNFPAPSVLSQNGGFAAFRILEQDVAGFEQYTNNQPGIDPETLVAKFCGRWRNGNPLALCPVSAGDPLPAEQLSNFNYANDPNGDVTPIGSHTRRGNPRGSESFPSPVPDHRIVRRAMPYGPAYQQGSNDTTPRGLIGYFVGTSLEQQFEFIQKVWINGQNFAGNFQLPQGTDPVLGVNNPQSSAFDFPPSGHVSGFEQFITTKGGLYCFLPSIPALQWMSQQP
ncbi:MAG TPA: peroxidase [Thermoanaerobaculia bacterium]|nr:peroxidase [Thermoanaerobaculia bacterium]